MDPAPVIVCGLGEVGHHIVELLVRLGERVVVITDQAREERLQAATAAQDAALKAAIAAAKARFTS